MWQWIKHGATLQPGNKPLTKEGFEAALKDELAALRKQVRYGWPSGMVVLSLLGEGCRTLFSHSVCSSNSNQVCFVWSLGSITDRDTIGVQPTSRGHVHIPSR